jgi:hypothetical protein
MKEYFIENAIKFPKQEKHIIEKFHLEDLIHKIQMTKRCCNISLIFTSSIPAQTSEAFKFDSITP